MVVGHEGTGVLDQIGDDLADAQIMAGDDCSSKRAGRQLGRVELDLDRFLAAAGVARNRPGRQNFQVDRLASSRASSASRREASEMSVISRSRRRTSCWMTSISRFFESSFLASGRSRRRCAARSAGSSARATDVGREALDRLDAVVERVGHVAQRRSTDCRSRPGGRRNRGSPRALAATPHADGGRRQRRSGLAMVEASSIDRMAVTSARRRRRAGWPSLGGDDLVDVAAWVDSSSTPSTARKRWIGTATETISSPCFGDPHDRAAHAGQRLHHFGIAAPLPPGASL
jgi:hypothetical protein